jgi:hypothetical protein
MTKILDQSGQAGEKISDDAVMAGVAEFLSYDPDADKVEEVVRRIYAAIKLESLAS